MSQCLSPTTQPACITEGVTLSQQRYVCIVRQSVLSSIHGEVEHLRWQLQHCRGPYPSCLILCITQELALVLPALGVLRSTCGIHLYDACLLSPHKSSCLPQAHIAAHSMLHISVCAVSWSKYTPSGFAWRLCGERQSWRMLVSGSTTLILVAGVR